MINIIEGAGIFIYPLGFCSIIATLLILERFYALQTNHVIPINIQEKLSSKKFPHTSGDDDSIAGKIIHFFNKNNPDSDSLKVYSKLEATRLERGLFILDIVIAGAPLIGLLGTVVGLIDVFAHLSPDSGIPDPSTFIQGIALALTTTMLGLAITIPALIANSYLNRRVDLLYAKLDILVQRLIEFKNSK